MLTLQWNGSCKTEAIVAELERQGVADALEDLGFDPIPMAHAVIKAADCDVVPFPKPRAQG